MNNPYIKNSRTGCYEDIFNKASHYSKVLSTKSVIDNKHDNTHRSIFCPSINSQSRPFEASLIKRMTKSLEKSTKKHSRYA